MKATKETVPDEEKQSAMFDYQKNLKNVMETKQMTDTDCWKSLHKYIHNAIDFHKTALEDAEKPRDVAFHQAGIKTLRAMIDTVRNPIIELDHYVMNCPLFCQDMKTRAKWNEPLGIVEITEV